MHSQALAVLLAVMAPHLMLELLPAALQRQKSLPPVVYLPPEAKTLPTGRLQLVSGSGGGAFFLDLDRTRRSGEIVDVAIYFVPMQPFEAAGGTVVHWIEREQIDCRKRMTREGGSATMDAEGKVLVDMPIDSNGDGFQRPPRQSAQQLRMMVLCDGVVLPAENTVVGYQQAQALARSVLSSGQPSR